ncbi:MAG: hypothetical protein KI792_05430 [Alphaproteobacteria bacterium]|nr:hypothetical protein [Alphaproteobacteria bacterium SS10]
MRRSLLKNLLQARQASLPVALVTDLKTGQQSLVYPMPDKPPLADGELGFEENVLVKIGELISGNTVDIIEAADTELFVQPHITAG